MTGHFRINSSRSNRSLIPRSALPSSLAVVGIIGPWVMTIRDPPVSVRQVLPAVVAHSATLVQARALGVQEEQGGKAKHDERGLTIEPRGP